MQVAALDLKSRGLLFSGHSCGSPAVFNEAAADRWDNLFEGDASQRYVANQDAIVASIPTVGSANATNGTEYKFVNTGIHVHGTSPVYGQDYDVCSGWNEDPRCAGGNSEADHYCRSLLLPILLERSY